MENNNTPNTEVVTNCDHFDIQFVQSRIYIIRDKQFMIDGDLAQLYKVETRALNQAVKRNSERFPERFMFQLTKEEYKSLRSHLSTLDLKSQNVTSSWGGKRKMPYVDA